MKTIVICLDSFKEEYLSYTPYLKFLTKEHAHGPLKTILCYTGIGAAVVTGKYPKDTKIWREFIFSDQSPFTWFNIFTFLDQTKLRSLFRLIINLIITLI